MRLRCFFLPREHPLHPSALQPFIHAAHPVPPLLALLFSTSSNSSSSRTGNRQIFCYLRINIFIEFASVESERKGGWTAPTGVWFHPFSAWHGVDSFWAFVFRACQKLCKYACHFHLPIAVRRRALSAGQTN